MIESAGGFFGKIPSRGDFVRRGLPSPVVKALEDWCQAVLPASRERLGERWTEAWMAAPIWHWRVAAGGCGPDALAGVWLPSTDRAGRLFPLIMVLVGPGLSTGSAGLDALERLGLAAIERDVTPEQLGEAVDAALAVLPTAPLPGDGSEWWTTGGPYVAAARRTMDGLPRPAEFAAMLQD